MRKPAVLALAALLAASSCGDDSPAGPSDAAVADAPLPAPDAPPACDPGVAPEPGLVITGAGALRGAAAGGTFTYKGVPYAAPPVGELRWRAPEPHACWSGERDATQFGPECPQLDEGAVVGDEDCLTLNVWAPAAPPSPPAPVMVFIHGGGNSAGSSSEPYYDGRELAERGGAVVVTINYRIGQLGWLAHPALSAERPEGVSGNWGLLDQVAALRWVQAEIAAFGGDPAKVLVFGESAGGRNVCTLVATPAAAGLFQRALVQSGSCGFLEALAEAEAYGGMVATAAGCDGAADVAACLRGLDAATIAATLPSDVGALAGSDYNPIVDGVVLPEMPVDALAAGTHHHAPFAIGANADETGREAPAIATVEEYEALVRAQFGGLGDAILAQYPAAAYPTPRKAYVALTSDARFICPSRRFARAAAAGQAEPVWRYLFAHAPGPLGAVHGLELVYLFRTFAVIPGYTPTAADLAVSDAMIGWWSRFAAAGDPNGAGPAAWPEYASDGSDRTLVIDDPPASVDGIRAAQCDFWDTLY